MGGPSTKGVDILRRRGSLGGARRWDSLGPTGRIEFPQVPQVTKSRV